MEIVSKPDMRTPDEVSAYIKKLRSIMRYLGTCDGNMQEGSLRADVIFLLELKALINLELVVRLKMLTQLNLCKWLLIMKLIDKLI